MKSEVVFCDGRRLNLAYGVTPELYAELEGTPSPRSNPFLSCGKCGGGLFIQHSRRDREQLFGYHHVDAGCTATFVVTTAPMSDEHKRQAEYHVLAARSVGLDADTEVTTGGRTRVDVVVDRRIGFEIQRSALSRPAAVDRTARSVKAGRLETVAWFTDWESSPAWDGHVPGYRTTLRSAAWKKMMPAPRTARAAGISTFEAGEKAVLVGGRFQLRTVPRMVQLFMLVDDVVPAIAQGLIKPVILGKFVRLIRAEGVALWGEITGYPLAVYDAGEPRSRSLAPSAEELCQRAGLPANSFTLPAQRRGMCNVGACGKPGTLYPAGWLCEEHAPAPAVTKIDPGRGVE